MIAYYILEHLLFNSTLTRTHGRIPINKREINFLESSFKILRAESRIDTQ